MKKISLILSYVFISTTIFSQTVIKTQTNGGKNKNVIVKTNSKNSKKVIVKNNTAKNNISCFSSVGKSHHEKIDASKWCNALKDKFGGRGGGKPTNSQWSGDLSVGTDAVVAICKEFAASSLA